MDTATATAPPVGRAQRVDGTGRLAARPVDGRTRLARLYQEGAAKIRLPATFTDEMEAVLINTAGGLTGGDRLSWTLEAGEGSRLVATTQACEKIYKATAGTAAIAATLAVGRGARLDWLPQETILFDRAALARSLTVTLAEEAEFLAVEAVCLGRTAMGETVASGCFRDRWRILRGGRLIHADDLRLEGPVAARAGLPAVLAGHAAFATLLYCGPRAEAHLARLRGLLAGAMAGASAWQGKLVARLVAPDGHALRKILVPAISALREDATLPKVWHL